VRYLVEATLMNPSTSMLETFYWSSGGSYPPFLPLDADRPNKFYVPLIQNVNGVSVLLFPKGATSGQSSLGAGVITLLNLGGQLDYLISWGYVGRSIKVWYGDTNTFSNYTLYFSGVVDTIDFTYSSKSAASLKITVKDKKKLFDKDIATNRYLGTNSAATGNEGTLDAGTYNKLKPLCFGRCWNISPVLVNDAGHRYQVHDGAISDVDVVYDNGVALVKSLTSPPASGYYFVDASNGIFTLGAKPAGQVTCDVKGATVAGIWAYTYADIGKLIVKTYGGLADADLDLTALATLNSSIPYTAGIYISGVEAPKIGEKTSSTILSVLDTLLQDSLVYWIFDIQGKFSMGSILPPETQPSLQTLDKYTNIEVELLPNVDDNKGIPCGKLSLQAVKNWTVQNSGLAGAVTDTRQSWLKQEFREFVKVNAINTFIHNSELTKVVKNSLLAIDSEAATVAQTLMDFYSVGRRPFKIVLDQSKLLPSVVPTKCITLQLDRFGFNSGRKVIVLGIAHNTPRLNQVELTVYGKVGIDL
jgi:hypothetical protein